MTNPDNLKMLEKAREILARHCGQSDPVMVPADHAVSAILEALATPREPMSEEAVYALGQLRVAADVCELDENATVAKQAPRIRAAIAALSSHEPLKQEGDEVTEAEIYEPTHLIDCPTCKGSGFGGLGSGYGAVCGGCGGEKKIPEPRAMSAARLEEPPK